MEATSSGTNKQAMHDGDTAIHHTRQATFSSNIESLVTHDTLLQPQCSSPDLHGLAGNLRGVFRPAEYVHNINVHVLRNIEKAGTDLFAVNRTPGRMYRNDAVSIPLEKSCDLMAGAIRLWRTPDDGNV